MDFFSLTNESAKHVYTLLKIRVKFCYWIVSIAHVDRFKETQYKIWLWVDVTMSLGHNVKMRAEKRWETRKTTVVTWPRRTSEISPPKARWMHHPFLGDGFLQPYGMISIVAWALSTLLLWFHELSNCWRKNILDVTVMTYSPEVSVFQLTDAIGNTHL